MKALLSLFFAFSLFGEEINSPIYITKENTVVENKYFRLAKNSNCPMIVVGDNEHENPQYRLNHIVLKNLFLDGATDYQTRELYKDGFLRNNCITIRGCSDVTIENVVVCYARSGGVVLEKGCSKITIDGFAACETTDSVVMNGLLHSNQYAGISMDWRCNGNKFFNLNIENNIKCGVFLRYCNDNTFYNITFKYSGIYINRRPESPDTGCHGNRFLKINDIPIYVGKDCEGNTIQWGD